MEIFNGISFIFLISALLTIPFTEAGFSKGFLKEVPPVEDLSPVVFQERILQRCRPGRRNCPQEPGFVDSGDAGGTSGNFGNRANRAGGQASSESDYEEPYYDSTEDAGPGPASKGKGKGKGGDSSRTDSYKGKGKGGTKHDRLRKSGDSEGSVKGKGKGGSSDKSSKSTGKGRGKGGSSDSPTSGDTYIDYVDDSDNNDSPDESPDQRSDEIDSYSSSFYVLMDEYAYSQDNPDIGVKFAMNGRVANDHGTIGNAFATCTIGSHEDVDKTCCDMYIRLDDRGTVTASGYTDEIGGRLMITGAEQEFSFASGGILNFVFHPDGEPVLYMNLELD